MVDTTLDKLLWAVEELAVIVNWTTKCNCERGGDPEIGSDHSKGCRVNTLGRIQVEISALHKQRSGD
jgi:hypothetical protein